MLPIVLLSLRALGRGRRMLVLALVLTIPAAVALAYISGESQPDGRRFAVELFDQLVVPVLLPLTALIFASSALGGEIEDRTLIYLTLRPVSRASIVVAKWLSAALLTTVLVGLAIAAMCLVATSNTTGTPPGAHESSPLWPLLAAGTAGALAYSGLFLLVGVQAPRRGLLVGIIYVLVWEGIVSGLSSALATLSIRRYVQALLDGMLGGGRLAAIRPSTLSAGTGILVLLLIAAAALVGTTLLLRRVELP